MAQSPKSAIHARGGFSLFIRIFGCDSSLRWLSLSSRLKEETPTYPFQISMNDTRLMEIYETACDIFQLGVRLTTSSRKSSDHQSSYQSNPICLPSIDIFKDASVRHHLRDHRKLSDLRLDFHCNELMDVGMGHVFPDDAFLAESLGFVFRFCQSSRVVKQAALRTS